MSRGHFEPPRNCEVLRVVDAKPRANGLLSDPWARKRVSIQVGDERGDAPRPQPIDLAGTRGRAIDSRAAFESWHSVWACERDLIAGDPLAPDDRGRARGPGIRKHLRERNWKALGRDEVEPFREVRELSDEQLCFGQGLGRRLAGFRARAAGQTQDQ